jgi:hypothetical protein
MRRDVDMGYLLSSVEAIVGLGLVAAWWIALTFLGARWGDKPMSALRFAIVPCVFLLWFVSGFILILRGVGAL